MMRFFSGLAAGVVATLAIFLVAALVSVKFGLVPARADVPPSKLERTLAHTSLDATIEREAVQPPYPFPNNDATMIAGAKLYMQQCSACHGSGVGDPTDLAQGLYIRPPQFQKHGVDDDPEGETYWKIEHGIRFTAMPAYDKTLTEQQIWQITYFMKNLPDHLPAKALAIWNQPVKD